MSPLSPFILRGEKPPLSEADALMASGALWNTLVLASKVDTLWRLGWRSLPELMPRFERLGDAIGTSREGRVLDAVYRDMPVRNFPSGLLEQAPEEMAVLELRDVLWSDWGKPGRIVNTLRRIAKPPAFPLDCLDRPFRPVAC
jgi:mannose-1-phosphate guanylyltransferase